MARTWTIAFPLTTASSDVLHILASIGGRAYPRIVGGTKASQGEFPWQVSIQLAYKGAWRQICGGGLIAERWVLTAAHCLQGIRSDQLRVSLGDFRMQHSDILEQRIALASYTIHPDFNRTDRGLPNDIGLIRLQDPIKLNSQMMTIALSAKEDDTFSASDVCYVSGWGRTSITGSSSIVLRKSRMKIVPRDSCSGYWPDMIQPSHICAVGSETDASACIGDSGGPLVCQRTSGHVVLVGVTSWGGSTCSSRKPIVFTSVATYRDWIDRTIET